MIDTQCLGAEWLEAKRKQYKRDPAIMESMIYALYLLEQLKLTGLDFIFKGGTSLILILDQPQRFSVDIDIIVPADMKREELEEHLSKIVETSSFISMRVDERRSYKEGIPKAHYIFTFKSNVTAKNIKGEVVENPEREILLDVLFADSHYPKIVERAIETDWLKHEGEALKVKTPDVNSIAGDKLTAFAPGTTGVPYHREGVNRKGEAIKSEMFMEIIKQLFDVGCLFDLLDDIETFKTCYRDTAAAEIKYRPERKIGSVESVLEDTIATAMLIAKKDVHTEADDKEKFAYLDKGIGQFGHFVYTANFRIDHAQVAAAKAAYLCAIILSGTGDPLKKFEPGIALADYMISHPDYNFLNKRLKFIAGGEALFYWNEVVRLLYTPQAEQAVEAKELPEPGSDKVVNSPKID
jgi:hypothetical protein